MHETGWIVYRVMSVSYSRAHYIITRNNRLLNYRVYLQLTHSWNFCAILLKNYHSGHVAGIFRTM